MVDGRNGIGIRPYACLHKVRARATVQYHVLTVRHLHTSFTFFFYFLFSLLLPCLFLGTYRSGRHPRGPITCASISGAVCPPAQ